ncbi:tetratricopeptide repeat protein [Oscillochloris sp. ZM17-4]|uniref:ATP-binding protein n=1 Tax=Oscillochloris sp. ZM17-4 TaxID=2866714 RepID=UPI001C72C1D0|nr:tetratricopeptide repeat protein [Oscillochloris sp. ZM17-4]MBX0326089.1 tetratricopeptide repeat protein [Oscillochloris sp. ZM17-4]
MAEHTSFGRWIKLRRTTLDLTQPTLADRVGCSPSLLRKLESGTRHPTRQMAERLIRTLDAPPDQHAALLALAFDELPPPPAQDRYPGHLPSLPAPLIGREAALADLCQRLAAPDARLVSVLGPPGVGKTSLAISAAAALRPVFADGVCFVDLAPQRDERMALSEIARAFGIHVAAEVSVAEALAGELRNWHVLLLLDNCEHLPDLARPLAALLNNCPQLRILTTSRAPLRVRAERRFLLAPLELPAPTGYGDPAVVRSAPATAMFLERATAVAASFTLDAETARAVSAICAQIDGLPLAIELAAARCDTITPAALLAQIRQQPPLLFEGPLDMPERHQTLDKAISWSYAMLAPREQLAFARLGVFARSFALAEGALVAGEQAEVIQTLADHHLIQREAAPNGAMRYRLLETLRQFALDRLAASGHEDTARRQHALAYTALAERAEHELRGPHDSLWLSQIDADLENFRAAIERSISFDNGQLAARITTALHTYWVTRSLWRNGYRIAPLLEAGASALSPELMLRALYTVGFSLSQHSSIDNARRATALFQTMRRIGKELGDVNGTGRALTMLAMMSRYPGNYAHVRALLDEGMALVGDGDPGLQLTLYHQMGMLLQEAGDVNGVVEYFEQAAQLSRELGRIVPLARALPSLAEARLIQGHMELALDLCNQALALTTEHNIPDSAAEARYIRGMIAARSGQPDEARACYEASLAEFRKLGMPFGTARVECLLGQLDLLAGDSIAAEGWFRAALQTSYEIMLIEVIGYSLGGLAAVAAASGQLERAARLLGAADAVRQRFALRADPDDTAARYQAIQVASVQLGPAQFERIRRGVADTICARLIRVSFDTTYEALQTLALPTVIGEAIREASP